MLKNYIKKIIEQEVDINSNKIKELEKSILNSIEKLDRFIHQYKINICDNCGKSFLAHYGGFYATRDYIFIDGKKTDSYNILVCCSSKCLDEKKNLRDKKLPIKKNDNNDPQI